MNSVHVCPTSVLELSTKWTSRFLNSLLVVLDTIVVTSEADFATPITSVYKNMICTKYVSQQEYQNTNNNVLIQINKLIDGNEVKTEGWDTRGIIMTWRDLKN